ncbi:hypothetical protein CV014_28940 [Nostoc sp. CMAA1605]|nr:hypothetical protein [Nostoc sp. CMAA1605]
MAKVHDPTEVAQVAVFGPVELYGFIFAQPVFITCNNAAAQTKIPGKERIDIKQVYVFIVAGDKGARQQVTLGIYIVVAGIMEFIPVVAGPQGEVHA